MGSRSYFTFTETAIEADILARHLNHMANKENFVYGAFFALKLHEPFRERHFAVAWSGHTSGGMVDVGKYHHSTWVLDDLHALDPAWTQDQVSIGVRLSLNELSELVAADLIRDPQTAENEIA